MSVTIPLPITYLPFVAYCATNIPGKFLGQSADPIAGKWYPGATPLDNETRADQVTNKIPNSQRHRAGGMFASRCVDSTHGCEAGRVCNRVRCWRVSRSKWHKNPTRECANSQ